MLDYIVSRLAMMRRGEFDWRSIRYRVMRVFWRLVRLATGFGTPIWIAHHSGWHGIGNMAVAIAWFLFLVILIDSTDVGGAA